MKVVVCVLLVCLPVITAQMSMTVHQLTDRVVVLQNNQRKIAAKFPTMVLEQPIRRTVNAPVQNMVRTNVITSQPMQPRVRTRAMPTPTTTPTPLTSKSVAVILTDLTNHGAGYPEALKNKTEEIILQEKLLIEQAASLDAQGRTIGGVEGDILLKQAEELRLKQAQMAQALQLLVELQTEVTEFFDLTMKSAEQMRILLPAPTPVPAPVPAVV